MVELLTVLLLSASANGEPDPSALVSAYDRKKTELERVDTSQRELMSKLYDITKRMKSYSKRRDILNRKMFHVEGNVRNLARQTAELQNKLDEQKSRLSKRLRAIYMLGDEGLVRAIFSSASSQELDQTLRYLKRVSEHDYKLIKAYQADIKELQIQKQKVSNEVRKFITIKNRIREQEDRLAMEQKAKSALLEKLREERMKTVNELKGIRRYAERHQLDELLDTSFFEFKGKLDLPFRGRKIRDFGLIEDEEFRYRLAHKGLLYQLAPKSFVRSVHEGKVAFADEVPGHGLTLVIDHGDHYYSVYAMNSKISVEKGDRVKKGQTVAESSAYAYFEIRHFSDAIDPKPWFREGT